MKAREIIKKLKKHGWQEKKANGGSHQMMVKGSQKVPVPKHGAKDLPTWLVEALEKQTGVKLR